MVAGTRARDGEKTRRSLVQAAFEDMRQHGFQGSSIDRILERLDLTRGALFHHFPTKLALGYAVVEEEIREDVRRSFIRPLEEAADPVETLATLIENHARKTPMNLLLLGCPLNNLAQEMSPLDGGFRQVTGEVFELWLVAIETALRRGQKMGRIRKGVSTRDAAVAVLALFEGGVSLTKNAQDRGPLLASARAVRQYLSSLAPRKRKT